MKALKYLMIGFGLMLSSCSVPVTYFGDKYPPTTSVDLYYSAHDVKKPYKIIGHMAYPNLDQEHVLKKFSDFAKSIGADAIIINGTQATKDNVAAAVNADALKYTN